VHGDAHPRAGCTGWEPAAPRLRRTPAGLVDGLLRVGPSLVGGSPGRRQTNPRSDQEPKDTTGSQPVARIEATSAPRPASGSRVGRLRTSFDGQLRPSLSGGPATATCRRAARGLSWPARHPSRSPRGVLDATSDANLTWPGAPGQIFFGPRLRGEFSSANATSSPLEHWLSGLPALGHTENRDASDRDRSRSGLP